MIIVPLRDYSTYYISKYNGMFERAYYPAPTACSAAYYIFKYKIVSRCRVFEFSLKALVSLFRKNAISIPRTRRVYKRRAELYYGGTARDSRRLAGGSRSTVNGEFIRHRRRPRLVNLFRCGRNGSIMTTEAASPRLRG